MGRHADRIVEAVVGRRAVRPLYARALRLKHINPGDIACFVLLECSFGVAMVLTLAGLASWWSVVVLPVTIALMVKLNDIVAGLADGVSGAAGRASSTRRANSAASQRPPARRARPAAAPRATGTSAARITGTSAVPRVAGSAAAPRAAGASAAPRANPGCSTPGGSTPRQQGAQPRTPHRHGRGSASAGGSSAPRHRATPAHSEPELPPDPTGEELIAFFSEFGGGDNGRRTKRGSRRDTPS
jgi:hypothetical protein